MRKCDIVKNIVGMTGIETRDVDLIVSSFIKVIKNEVGAGTRVEIRGFGVFEPKARKAKTGRDISRGKPVHVPARVVPTFKHSKKFFTIKKQSDHV
jgi:DNA-binding protein HU-beta